MKNEFPDPGFLFAPVYIIGSICNRFCVLREDPYLSGLVKITSASDRTHSFTKFDLDLLELYETYFVQTHWVQRTPDVVYVRAKCQPCCTGIVRNDATN